MHGIPSSHSIQSKQSSASDATNAACVLARLQVELDVHQLLRLLVFNGDMAVVRAQEARCLALGLNFGIAEAADVGACNSVTL